MGARRAANSKAEIGLRGRLSVVVGRGIVKAEGRMVVVNMMKEKD